MRVINYIRKFTDIFTIIFRDISICVASMFLLVFYCVFIRRGEYFLDSKVIYIPLIAILILNVFAMIRYKKYIRKSSIIGALIGLMIIIGLNEIICIRYTNFSSEIWANNENIRHFMVEDLMENYLKKNMTVTEVEKLLGENFLHKNEGNIDQNISYCYSYYGYHERVSNNMYLDIYFNSQNKVVSWKTYEEKADWL